MPGEDRLLAVQLMAVQGPMARRVADVRVGLKALMGAHPRDPWSIDAPFEGPPIAGRIRVAVVSAPPGGGIDPAVAAGVRRAADALADAGYDVVEACPPRYAEGAEVWARFLMGDFASVLGGTMSIMGADGVSFLNAANAGVAPLTDAASMSNLMVQRDGIAREWSIFAAAHPLILTPTWTRLSFEHGFDLANPGETMELIRPVTHANLLGLPSACVPAGLDSASGLPVGVLLTGQRLREDLCLDAAEAVEARLGLQTPIDPMG